MTLKFFVLFLVVVQRSWTLDCTQIPESQIFAGSTVCLPGPSCGPQTLPANFNCLYSITVPTTDVSGLYANLTVFNGMKGVNDFMIVWDITMMDHTLNSRRGNGTNSYFVTPGAQMTIQVTTKSVVMNSQFRLLYPTLFITTALNYDSPDCASCFVIDGNFTNQQGIYKLTDVAYSGWTTNSNQVTVVSFQDGYVGLVLNTKSEAKQFKILAAVAAANSYLPNYAEMEYSQEAAEIVNFSGTGIIMRDVRIQSSYCNAHIVSGPPNNSSKFLLDIATGTFPHHFDLPYFTIINYNCSFGFGVEVSNPS